MNHQTMLCAKWKKELTLIKRSSFISARQ